MKKLMMCFLTGILLISMTACGNKTDARGGHMNPVNTDTKDVKAMFKNSVFMGDSITEGFAVNEILPEDSVMAGAGATARWIYETYIDALAKKKPDKVFIMLGSDDMLMPKGDPKELFRNDLTKLVNKIKEELPGTKIYLQSITPVTQEALKQEPRYGRIDEYNELLKELAGELSVNYTDIGTIANQNPNLFAEDGIHFKKEFYTLWLNKLSEVI